MNPDSDKLKKLFRGICNHIWLADHKLSEFPKTLSIVFVSSKNSNTNRTIDCGVQFQQDTNVVMAGYFTNINGRVQFFNMETSSTTKLSRELSDLFIEIIASQDPSVAIRLDPEYI